MDSRKWLGLSLSLHMIFHPPGAQRRLLSMEVAPFQQASHKSHDLIFVCRYLLCLHFYGACFCPIGQSRAWDQSQSQCGRGLHENMYTGRSDILEVVIVAVWCRSQKWKWWREIRRLCNNPEKKKKKDGLHQSNDNGSFKKCLDSEYRLKGDLIFTLLSP